MSGLVTKAERERARGRMTGCAPLVDCPHYALGVPGPLSNSDLALLRGVLDDPVGSIRTVPSAPRSPTSERLAVGRIRLTLRSSGPADQLASAIARQVMPREWVEVASRYPMERVFEGL